LYDDGEGDDDEQALREAIALSMPKADAQEPGAAAQQQDQKQEK